MDRTGKIGAGGANRDRIFSRAKSVRGAGRGASAWCSGAAPELTGRRLAISSSQTAPMMLLSVAPG